MSVCSCANSVTHSTITPLDNSAPPSYIKQFESAMIQMDVQQVLELIDIGFDAFNCSLEEVLKSPIFIDNLINASWSDSFKKACLLILETQIQEIEDLKFQELTKSLQEVILYLKDKIEEKQEISDKDLKNYAKEFYRFSFLNEETPSISLLETAVFFLKNEALIEKWIDSQQKFNYQEHDEIDCCTHVTSFLLVTDEGLSIITRLIDKGYNLAKILLSPKNSESVFANEFLTEELYHFLTDYPRPSLLRFILDLQYDLDTFLMQEEFEGSENLYYYLIESLYEQNSLNSLMTVKLLLEETQELARTSLQNMDLELELDTPNLDLRREILEKIKNYKK